MAQSPLDYGKLYAPPQPCCGANDAPRNPVPPYPGDSPFLSSCGCARPQPELRFRPCSSLYRPRAAPASPWLGAGSSSCAAMVVLMNSASPWPLLLWPHGHCPVAVELWPWALVSPLSSALFFSPLTFVSCSVMMDTLVVTLRFLLLSVEFLCCSCDEHWMCSTVICSMQV